MPLFIFCTDDSSPNVWRFRASANSLDELLQGCYNNTGSLLKSDFTGVLIRNANLPHCVTATPTDGQVFELNPVVQGMSVIESVHDFSKARKFSDRLSNRSKSYFKNKTLIFGLLVCISVLASCGYSKNLTGRYKKAEVLQINTFGDTVAIKGYALDIPAEKQAAPFRPINLATEAQVRLIKELGKDLNDPEKLLKILGTPIIATNSDEPTIVKKFAFSKRIVLSVRNKSPFSENRISKIEIRLTSPNTVLFTGCNKLVTEYQTIDQGKLTFKNNITGELSATGEFGPSGSIERNFFDVTGNSKGGFDTATNKVTANAASKLGVGGKLGFARELYEEASLKQRYVSLTASVNDNEASFYQESISGIDLSGNIIADIEFEVPQNQRVTENYFQFESIGKDGSYLGKDKIKIKRIYEIYPNAAVQANDIRVALYYEGVFRRVIKGGKTTIEGDDNIQLITGSKNQPSAFILARRHEMIPKRWYLQSNLTTLLRFATSANTLPQSLKEINFRDYFSAKSLLDWIKNNNVGNGTSAGSQSISAEKIYLYLGNVLLSDANKGQLEINVSGF